MNDNFEQADQIFKESKWIWAEDNTVKNDWVIFRRKFTLEKPPKRALCRMSASTHYYMYVNGKAAVWEGSLSRGSLDYGYYDETDAAKLLVKGENVLVFICCYYGNEGKDGVDLGAAGFIFESEDLGIFSGSDFKVFRNGAYAEQKPPIPSKLYGGYNLTYDATRENQLDNVLEASYGSNIFSDAVEYGGYPSSPYNELRPRPIPNFRFGPVTKKKYVKISDQFAGDTYIMTLPHAMQVSPYIEVFANGQEKIDIRTDRYETNGSFGDETNVYTNQRVEYTCKPLAQQFDAKIWLSGEKLIFSMPSTVKVLDLGYRESGYDTELTGEFKCDDPGLDKLMEKCENTLLSCMRETFMDSPDRERTMWLGDASVEADAALHILDDNAAKLVRKTIDDMFAYRGGDVLRSNVPGCCPAEIPSQGLLAIGLNGIVAHYIRRYDDNQLLKTILAPMVAYLRLWNVSDTGLVTPRDGNKRWFDHLYNVDETVLENALYYSALRFCKYAADLIGDISCDVFLDERMRGIERGFEEFWDGTGYTSSGVYDERANAFAVLSGLAPEERYPSLAKLMVSTANASPYMEGFVLEALCRAGRNDYAYNRLCSRYARMIASPGSTLPEDFNISGTLCHGWSVAPVSVLHKYFAGVQVREGSYKISVTPDLTALGEIEFQTFTPKGRIAGRYRKNNGRVEIFIENGTLSEVLLVLKKEKLGVEVGAEGDRVIKLNKGRNKFVL